MNCLILIFSIVLFLFAPSLYSRSYCVLSCLLFLICALGNIINSKKADFIGFNFFFTVSFFACCYIFPVFVYSIEPNISLFRIGYNVGTINKATCLATIAYCCYSIGYMKNKISNIVVRLTEESNTIFRREKILIFVFCFFFIIVFYLINGFKFLNSQYSEGLDSARNLESPLYSYIYTLLSLIPILIGILLYKNFDFKIVILSLCITLPFLVSGSRTIPLSLYLCLFYFFCCKYKLKLTTKILIIFGGIILMALFSRIRMGLEYNDSIDEFTESSVGIWSLFTDLFVCNRNLYDAIEIVQSEGIKPTVFLGSLLNIIPMAQSLVCHLFGIAPYEMTSSSYITYFHYGLNAPIGLGTNIVGDVYLASGMIGVILLFYFLGFIISKSIQNINTHKIRWKILYLSLLCNSIFMCRGAFWMFAKYYFWGIIIFFIVKKISTRLAR